MYFKYFLKRFISSFIVVLLLYNSLSAQKDTILLNETEVLSTHIPSLYTETSRVIQIITKAEIEKAPVQSLQELLEYALNVDVRQRGNFGVQSDISIRGGSFEQTLILLNGIKMNDPQTGHHSMNLPVELQDIDRIEILEGPGSRIFGANAFAGAINIITGSKNENKLKISVMGGENQLYSESASLSLSGKKMQHYISIGKKGSNAYIENTDFNISNVFYQNAFGFKNSKITSQFGFNDKAFGANSFYSVKYPNQYEQTRVFFANAGFQTTKKIKLTTNIYYRRHQDRFELFRNNPPAWYTTHNYHLTQTYGAEINVNFKNVLGKTAIGAELRSENILSNVLGDAMNDTLDVPFEPKGVFTKSKHRENLGMFIEHVYSFKKISISAGIFTNWNSQFDWKNSAGLDASFDITSKMKLFATVNQSLRLPTFTDLYYVGPTNSGNIKLHPEEAISYETGLKYFSSLITAHVSVFRRDGKNLIDWVKIAGGTKWESRNITNVISNGLEFSAKINFNLIFHQKFFINNIILSYCYLDLEKTSENYVSYYALDYLKNKMTASVNHRIYKNIKGSSSISFQERNGSYTDIKTGQEKAYDSFINIDSRIIYEKPNMNFYIEAANLLNTKYQDIGNILMPGRWIRCGINVSIGIGK